MAKVEPVTDAAFQEKVLKSSKPVIIDFWAEWCGPCKAISPVLEKISESHPEVSVMKMNVDENQQTPAQFGIRGIPTMILFNNGAEVDRLVGADPGKLGQLFEKGKNI